MFKTQGANTDDMFELLEVPIKTYSPSQWDKECGIFIPGNMYPQYFFESYPPFTMLIQYALLELFMTVGKLSIQYDSTSDPKIVITLNSTCVKGNTLRDAIAQLVTKVYPVVGTELKTKITNIVNIS